jgi:hypothetical protein
MAYEVQVVDVFRAWARMLGLIADGVPAGLIPVEGPSRFVFSVNTAAAERLPVAMVAEVLFLADRLVGAGDRAR